MMDIIEFAMQMELDGKEFYERSAQNAATPEFKEILRNLAEEEQRHYTFFKRLIEGNSDPAQKELEKGRSRMATIRNTIVLLTESDNEHSFGADARSVWTEALKIEVSAERMYREEAKKEKNSERKNLLNRIADEEQNHVYLIDNVLLFLTDPQTFIYSRQFADFKSWEGR